MLNNDSSNNPLEIDELDEEYEIIDMPPVEPEPDEDYEIIDMPPVEQEQEQEPEPEPAEDYEIIDMPPVEQEQEQEPEPEPAEDYEIIDMPPVEQEQEPEPEPAEDYEIIDMPPVEQEQEPEPEPAEEYEIIDMPEVEQEPESDEFQNIFMLPSNRFAPHGQLVIDGQPYSTPNGLYIQPSRRELLNGPNPYRFNKLTVGDVNWGDVNRSYIKPFTSVVFTLAAAYSTYALFCSLQYLAIAAGVMVATSKMTGTGINEKNALGIYLTTLSISGAFTAPGMVVRFGLNSALSTNVSKAVLGGLACAGVFLPTICGIVPSVYIFPLLSVAMLAKETIKDRLSFQPPVVLEEQSLSARVTNRFKDYFFRKAVDNVDSTIINSASSHLQTVQNNGIAKMTDAFKAVRAIVESVFKGTFLAELRYVAASVAYVAANTASAVVNVARNGGRQQLPNEVTPRTVQQQQTAPSPVRQVQQVQQVQPEPVRQVLQPEQQVQRNWTDSISDPSPACVAR